jgi:uncharacterized repeat protein (TIGR01451 family)
VKRFGVSALLFVALVLEGIGANAAPENGKVELRMVAEKEIEVAGADGGKIVKRVPAEKVIPGDEVIYTITYVNNGDEAAENLVLKNPIPEQMKYVGGSATGDNSAITYSVDDGRSFDVPGKLMVKDAAGKPVAASSADYTHIQWKLSKPVPPKSSGLVSFRARLK